MAFILISSYLPWNKMHSKPRIVLCHDGNFLNKEFSPITSSLRRTREFPDVNNIIYILCNNIWTLVSD